MRDVTKRIEEMRLYPKEAWTPEEKEWLCRLALAQEKVIAFRKSGTIQTREELYAWEELESARRDPA